MQNGPILIVDDDTDEHELIKDLWTELNISNEVLFFKGGQELLEYLRSASSAPFIIISDVNLPKMNGFELRQQLLNSSSPKFRSVPFIFWSTKASEAQIEEAFQLCAHGFFIKESSISEIKNSFLLMINYWQRSKMPAKTA